MQKLKIGPYKNWNVEGNIIIVDASPELGFNFAYTLYIPHNLKSETHLIVEDSNVNIYRRVILQEHKK